MMLGGAPISIALPFDQCVVPQGVNGPVAIYITSDGQPLANNIRDQATNSVVAGPTMAFIDTVQEDLSSLAHSSSGPGSSSDAGSSTASAAASSSTSVTTITPQQASSIIESISPSATALTVPPSGTATAAATATASASTGGNNAASGSTSVVLTPGGPNMYTGPVSNGALTVLGWTTVQAADVKL